MELKISHGLILFGGEAPPPPPPPVRQCMSPLSLRASFCQSRVVGQYIQGYLSVLDRGARIT